MSVAQATNEQRILLYNFSWDEYDTLLRVLGDRPIRITYDRGNIELMSPSRVHERYKGLFGRLIEALTEELNRPCESAGSMTFRREDLERGLEPDECF
jgi:Uma2 family endonuclease